MFAASKTDSASTGGYQISRSLRFNDADTAYLTRTPASASNRKTWTWSAWIKRGKIDRYERYTLFASRPTANPYTLFYFSGGAQPNQYGLRFEDPSADLQTTQVFRDMSAWYHIVLAVDTTQATASNRIKMYVNGSQITVFTTATYPPQNTDMSINNTTEQCIGSNTYLASTEDFDGYMTEINFIDGTQLTPSSFGETNAQTGVWQPKAYSGSYGTNGFYLNFSDNSNTTAATLGKDYSGNGNNWTPNNFSVTAGAGNDSLVDSPTSYGTDTGVGGTVRGNYCTLNPISTAGGTFTNGNLDWASPTTDGRFCISTISVNNMNCYCEVTIGSATSFQQVGVYGNPTTFNPRVQYRSDGNASVDGTTIATYASFTTNDIIGIAYNSSTGSTSFYKNGTLQGSMTATSTTVTQYFAAGSNSSGAAANYTFNFGQRPFAYTAPSGFKALCTQNLPTPTIGATTATQAGKFFNPVLYTGNGGTQSVTGVGFQPDWVWVKGRSGATDHGLYDAVRGVQKQLESNTTDAETTETTGITAFGSDGFTTGALAQLNTSAATYVAWNWKANGSGSSNTSGSITSTVSASTTSGFSVLTYTGTAVAATIGHGLGSAPSMIITKQRNGGPWAVYHTSLGIDQYVFLNTTAAANTVTGYWGTTNPSSTVFGVIGGGYNNNSGPTVAYCFAEIAGYSKFGSYTGNGSADGPFVFTGMRPAYLMLKRTDNTSDWFVYDATRSPYNAASTRLYPDLSNAEDTGGSTYDIDFLSNGFKLRGTGQINISGSTWIFMAFASAPLKFSLAR